MHEGTGMDGFYIINMKGVFDFISHYWILLVSTLGLTWSGVVLGFFIWIKKIGEGWVDQIISNRFSKDLESYKNTLAKDLELFKVKTGALLARSTKQQEKEFEVLNTIWEKLKDAEGIIHDLMSALQKFPDITTYSNKRLTTLLEKQGFDEDDRDAILAITSLPERKKTYEEKAMWYKLSNAEVASQELHNYTIRNAPSIPRNIYEKIVSVSKDYQDALSTYRFGKQASDHQMVRSAFSKVFPKADAIVDNIQLLIQEYLHPE